MDSAKVKIVRKDDNKDGSYYIELDINFTDKNSLIKEQFEHLRITRDSNGQIITETLPF